MVRMLCPKYCQMEQGLKVASKAVARFVFQALHEWLFQSNGPGVHHAAYWVFMNGLLKGKLVKGILFELPEVSPLTPHSSLVHFLHKDLHNFFSLIKDSISVWKWLLDIISHIYELFCQKFWRRALKLPHDRLQMLHLTIWHTVSFRSHLDALNSCYPPIWHIGRP